jgi:hypothetical protein
MSNKLKAALYTTLFMLGVAGFLKLILTYSDYFLLFAVSAMGGFIIVQIYKSILDNLNKK